jgi:hypothetical protein
MSDSAEGATKGVGLFSALEAATETTSFFLATTFVLLVDVVLVHFNHTGVIELIRNPELIKSSLGLEVILVFVGFSFLTSVALRILAVIVDEIVIETVGRAWITIDSYLERKFGIESQYHERKYDCVNPLELRREAHEKKDSYLLTLYANYEDRWNRNMKSMFKHALYAFYTLIMVLTNYFLFTQSDAQTVLRKIAEYVNSPTYIWWIAIPLVGMTYFRIFRSESPVWIYCPTLYRELEARDKAK